MTVLGNAHVVTMDDAGTELDSGWIRIEDGFVAEVGSGEPPEPGDDLAGAVVTPALINTHHHLFQTLTRARAQEADLFTWLKELYPLWARLDAEAEYAAARTGLAELALSGCGTVFDHHYVFPHGEEGLLDAVLEDTERLARLHEQGPGARVQLAVAPCSPFSVTGRLMTESAELARSLELPLHTHLAETAEEEAYCVELYGCRPVEYLEQLGWLAGDVWCAHCVHLEGGDIGKLAATGTGVAHCPTSNLRLGAGVAPVRSLLDAGGRVGLGVDGSASNERGRCADLAVWRRDMLELAGARDPVAGLVLSAPHRVDRLLVGGEDVVRDGELVRASEQEIAQEHRG